MGTNKILVISNMFPSERHPNYGIFIENFCKQLEEIGVPYDKQVLTKQDSKIIKIWFYILFFIKTCWQCLVGNYKYIYVHYLSVSSIPVLLAAKLKKLRIIANAHGTDIVPENPKQEKCQIYTRKILKLAEKIVVPSEYFKQYTLEKYGDIVTEKDIFIYPSGGIDDCVFYPVNNKGELYKKYKLDPDKIYLGYCGRIAKTKGIDVFLRAARCVLNECGDAKVIIVGGGEFEAEMDRRIKDLRLEESVIRYPMMRQESLREIYNILDVFIFPTEREGESLGLVAIESMACGTPVIASDYSAPKYYIEDGVNGFKFPLGDWKKLAEIILMVIRDYRGKQNLSDGALRTVELYKTKVVKDELKRIVR